MKIFIICPVRNMKEEEHKIISSYITSLEEQGHSVHYPPRDTNQNDPIGYNICTQNKETIFKADEVHVYYNPESTGTIFDLGMCFAFNKKIKLINKVYPTDGKKSFNNVLLKMSVDNP